jgi:hypothetical protein
LDTGKIVYGSDTESGREEILCRKCCGVPGRDSLEFDDIIIFPPVDPDPIQLDESGKVTVIIKTLDGDVRI